MCVAVEYRHHGSQLPLRAYDVCGMGGGYLHLNVQLVAHCKSPSYRRARFNVVKKRGDWGSKHNTYTPCSAPPLFETPLEQTADHRKLLPTPCNHETWAASWGLAYQMHPFISPPLAPYAQHSALVTLRRAT